SRWRRWLFNSMIGTQPNRWHNMRRGSRVTARHHQYFEGALFATFIQYAEQSGGLWITLPGGFIRPVTRLSQIAIAP
ncbi:hypothetical protein QIG13_28125, partial [Klebsiella pneumoniae]|nr:hypothetical protein [Klebsiella pneumoniae]